MVALFIGALLYPRLFAGLTVAGASAAEHLTPHPKAGLTEEQAPQASAGHENSRKRSVSLEEPTSSLGMRDRARQFETDERTHKQQRTQKRFRDEWDLDSNAESSTPSTEEVEP